MEKREFLVVFNYKGHIDSVVLETDEFSIEKDFRARKYKGVIEEIYYPGSWHYDPETDTAIPD